MLIINLTWVSPEKPTLDWLIVLRDWVHLEGEADRAHAVFAAKDLLLLTVRAIRLWSLKHDETHRRPAVRTVATVEVEALRSEPVDLDNAA
jgi:hypothetical protein